MAAGLAVWYSTHIQQAGQITKGFSIVQANDHKVLVQMPSFALTDLGGHYWQWATMLFKEMLATDAEKLCRHWSMLLHYKSNGH